MDIGVRREGATLILTFASPARRNAFDSKMLARITAEFHQSARDPALRAIILTGEGGHFCAGADLSQGAPGDGPGDAPGALQLRESISDVLQLYRAVAMGPLPVIAAVEGGAFGAGLSLAAASDIVVAAKGAKFGATFARIGLLPDCGLLYSLPQRIGMVRARRMMSLCTTVGAEEAFEIGLADELVEQGAALDRAIELAAQYAGVAPMSTAYTKMALASGMNSVDDVIRQEMNIVPILATSNDCREGITAFLEKRAPNFTGS